jgi:FAD:protein FMN transferase
MPSGLRFRLLGLALGSFSLLAVIGRGQARAGNHREEAAALHQTAASSPSVDRYQASHQAMGTEFTVAVYGRDPKFLAESVEQVFEEIDRIDDQMSNYKPGSELSEINRDAASHPVLVAPDLFALIEKSLEYSRETGGGFDITVGPLMKAWGFFRGQGRVPSAAELRGVLTHVGYQHVKLDAAQRTIFFDVPGVELDLGGIAKGYAVDRAVEILREDGITSALVSGGDSSIYALGAPPGEQAWKITLRDPFDATKPADTIYLKNFSMSTSGNYNKFFKLGGKMYSHVMNPHTGMPVEDMLSTTVFVASTTDSDALSKLYVLGVQGSRKYLTKHADVQALFFVPTGEGQNSSRVLLRSKSFNLPPDVVMKIEQ